MGLLDDAASVISAKSSHSKKSRRSSHKHRSRSRSRSRDRGSGVNGIAASIFGGGGSDSDSKHRRGDHKHRKSSTRSFFGTDDYKKHSASKSSFFGIPTGNGSRSSFFNFSSSKDHHRGSPSYYKRSPRPNFVSRVLRRLKRLLRDLVYYAKRHPLKVFMLVIMPLITGGFLTALLAKFGLRLPPSLMRMVGVAGKAASGDGIGLVGEAVRMASGAGIGSGLAGGLAKATTSIERGRDGSYQWERKHVERDFYGRGSGGGGGGWGDGLMGSVAKMFS
ncbi:hypothetical protein QBC47DRAFT_312169 [Echria macrotheca]|uniref:Uncharacterized protein n=1 Tax=Echria macrotheca TaxID=438768 RepID=A0AAJ0B4N6_9PEZI|nr:hypothetical protein QBC47DRAFT_312169 [Echria macrotheca]